MSQVNFNSGQVFDFQKMMANNTTNEMFGNMFSRTGLVDQISNQAIALNSGNINSDVAIKFLNERDVKLIGDAIGLNSDFINSAITNLFSTNGSNNKKPSINIEEYADFILVNLGIIKDSSGEKLWNNSSAFEQTISAQKQPINTSDAILINGIIDTHGIEDVDSDNIANQDDVENQNITAANQNNIQKSNRPSNSEVIEKMGNFAIVEKDGDGNIVNKYYGKDQLKQLLVFMGLTEKAAEEYASPISANYNGLITDNQIISIFINDFGADSWADSLEDMI